ncbi:MAG: hypothetical protein ACRDZO_18965 [Egibacteraceae bacterium]
MVVPVEDDARGIIAPVAGLARFRLDRHAPSAAVARFVDRYWVATWDLSREGPYTQRVCSPNNVAGIKAREEALAASFDAYLELLAGHGLLHADTDGKLREYAIRAATSGFSLGDQFVSEELQLPLEVKAGCLAEVVRRTFEPPGEPDPRALRAVAPQAIVLFDEMLAQCDPSRPRSAAPAAGPEAFQPTTRTMEGS